MAVLVRIDTDNQDFTDVRRNELQRYIRAMTVISVMRKLLKVLHYKHTGYILPRSGSMALDWITNAYLHTLKEDQEFIASLTGIPIVRRNGTDLSGQFSYRYGVDVEKLVSAFVLVFRNSLVGIGIVAHDERVLLGRDETEETA